MLEKIKTTRIGQGYSSSACFLFFIPVLKMAPFSQSWLWGRENPQPSPSISLPLAIWLLLCPVRATATRRERYPIYHAGEDNWWEHEVVCAQVWGSVHVSQKKRERNACLVKWGWFFRFTVISTFFTNPLIFLYQLFCTLTTQLRINYTFDWYHIFWLVPKSLILPWM